MYSIKKFREINTKKRGNKKLETICVVCCKICSRRDFEESGEVANEILDMLLLERDQTSVEGSVMCLKCFQKVNIIFEFKSACLYVEDFITPFVNTEEGNRIDLNEVYIRKRIIKTSSMLYLNVNNTRNAIVCGTCVGCLKDFCNFMESYSESRSSSCSQTTGRSLEADTEVNPLPKNSLASSSNRASTSTLIEGVGPLECESSSQIYQCDFCDYKSKLKCRMASHRLIHKDLLEIVWFKCDSCDYKTKRKVDLKRHTLIHKKPSEIKWFKCHFCDYKAKQKSHLKSHTLVHKNSGEIKWFECHLCDYKAKHKLNLKRHMLIHKDTSENEWFKCHLCNFKTKRKDILKTHTLIHRPIGN
ncbi:hypothetical protein NQ315_017041 [Exocentrus adspersus]|uniref:Protein hunchback n=1 Tax=Exocentrus adspersus TaxID=1586481 RepID=A0AAV8V5E2_9CUCU|nr:hypothetical protein NQ315_017041 [Exocentrus adspersus]